MVRSADGIPIQPLVGGLVRFVVFGTACIVLKLGPSNEVDASK
jgi:hypothetical protein